MSNKGRGSAKRYAESSESSESGSDSQIKSNSSLCGVSKKSLDWTSESIKFRPFKYQGARYEGGYSKKTETARRCKRIASIGTSAEVLKQRFGVNTISLICDDSPGRQYSYLYAPNELQNLFKRPMKKIIEMMDKAHPEGVGKFNLYRFLNALIAEELNSQQEKPTVDAVMVEAPPKIKTTKPKAIDVNRLKERFAAPDRDSDSDEDEEGKESSNEGESMEEDESSKDAQESEGDDDEDDDEKESAEEESSEEDVRPKPKRKNTKKH